MKNEFPTNNGAAKKFGIDRRSHRNRTAPFQEHSFCRRTGVRLKHRQRFEFTLEKKEANHPDWDTVAIWIFTVCLALISLLAGYQLWAKLSP